MEALNYLPTYLPAYLPAYLPTCLPTCLLTYLPTYLPICLSVCLYLLVYAYLSVPTCLCYLDLIDRLNRLSCSLAGRLNGYRVALATVVWR